MSYFSFSLKNRIYKKTLSNLNDILNDLEINKKYFSKNLRLKNFSDSPLFFQFFQKSGSIV